MAYFSSSSNSWVWSHDHDCLKKAQAFQLIELGARAGLVVQLTGLPKSPVKELYQYIHGRASPPGLNPFTDTWYLQTEQRMLHANVIWKLECRLRSDDQEPAQHLINLYQCYTHAVGRSILDIHRSYFVPQLLLIGAWDVRACKRCKVNFIGPLTDIDQLCPACKIQQLYRCQKCNKVLKQTGIGRRIKLCGDCRAAKNRNK